MKKLDPSTVAGNTFVVSIPGIHEVLYQEGGRTLSIEIEGGMDKHNRRIWFVYISAANKWLSPHDNDPLSEKDKRRIAHNVLESLKLLNMNVELS